ncbi:MAG TPA: hypothetical protein VK912_19300 [Longimicrobiales bacterium]|nr:hypothetical protein [Longimicrobiales bacterium]
MVRDYAADGCGSSALQFARDYYAHYPKIAIGNWPPLFYMVEGAWLLVTPVHAASVRVLLSLITVGLAWAVFLALRRDLDFAHSAFGAMLLLAMHPIASFDGTIMRERGRTGRRRLGQAWARFMDRPGLSAGCWRSPRGRGGIIGCVPMTTQARSRCSNRGRGAAPPAAGPDHRG